MTTTRARTATVPARRLWAGALWLAASALTMFACQEPKTLPTAGSNSNWLVPCDAKASCSSATACLCGACTRSCESDGECAGLEGARCVPNPESALISQCGRTSQEAGICLPACSAGSCEAGRACVSGGCVLVDMPPGAFCDGVRDATSTEQFEQDELLQALEDLRAAGGVSCGNDPPSPSLAPLRLDARLACAARVLAMDMNATRMRSLIDSSGRDTSARLAAADYVQGTWAESYALSPNSAADALRLMLEDADSCAGLTGDRVRDVGIGSIGSVRIITLAAE